MHLDHQDYEADRERREARELRERELRTKFADQASRGSLTLALPSGKSMEEPTFRHLNATHVLVGRAHPRACTTDITGLPGINRGIFFKPSQIPELVDEGNFALGITGMDAVMEFRRQDGLVIIATIPYSRAGNGGTRGVLFCRGKKRRLPKELIVISEYPVETKKFFDSKGIEATVVPCSGSAESYVVSGIYDWGVALVETGTSLKVNGLVEVDTVFTSEAVLVANKEAYANPAIRDYADFLGKLLVGVVEARDNRYLTMNAPVAAVEEIKKILPSRKSPTVQMLADEGFCAISSVVPIKGLNELKRRLLALGVTDIVELDHVSIV